MKNVLKTMEKQVLFDKGVYVIGGEPYLFDESLFIEKKKERLCFLYN